MHAHVCMYSVKHQEVILQGVKERKCLGFPTSLKLTRGGFSKLGKSPTYYFGPFCSFAPPLPPAGIVAILRSSALFFFLRESRYCGEVGQYFQTVAELCVG